MNIEIKKCAVLGAGVMGAQIAGHIANAGIPSLLFDVNNDLAKKGIEGLTKLKPAPLFSSKNTTLITPCTYDNDLEKLKDCDLIIEAVAEKIEIKHTVYKNLLPHLKENAILASNTSGIPLANLVEVLPDEVQSRFLISHFFNPPRYLRLLELVKGPKTSDDVYNTVTEFGEVTLGKGVVHAKDTPGFIGNRMLFGYTAQANMLLLEGALPHQIDQALESFGLNMGPFRMMDLVGLDLGWRARKLSGKESPLHAKIGDELCEQNRYGQKNGAGYYNYSEGSRAPNPAPENESTYEKISSDNGFTRREISDEEIVDRCVLALINEGADILSEGVAQRAADIDVVYINGYGFPIWRGGPMHHANAMGLDKVIEKLEKYRELTGNDVYKPSEMLITLAKNGERLGEAPKKEDRKQKLDFEMSSVANNF